MVEEETIRKECFKGLGTGRKKINKWEYEREKDKGFREVEKI